MQILFVLISSQNQVEKSGHMLGMLEACKACGLADLISPESLMCINSSHVTLGNGNKWEQLQDAAGCKNVGSSFQSLFVHHPEQNNKSELTSYALYPRWKLQTASVIINPLLVLHLSLQVVCSMTQMLLLTQSVSF